MPRPGDSMSRRRGVSALTRRLCVAAAWILWICSSMLQTSCRVPWDVPTHYELRDVDRGTYNEITHALSQYGVSNGEVAVQPNGETSYSFQLNDIPDMSALKRIQETIRRISAQTNVAVDLTEARLVFQSIDSNATVNLMLSGHATPGAVVHLDIGISSTVTPFVDQWGDWSTPIQSNARLTGRGGWVYGFVRKGATSQYFRVNVLDAASNQKIDRAAVPLDSALRLVPGF